jgi:hypothetical protein
MTGGSITNFTNTTRSEKEMSENSWNNRETNLEKPNPIVEWLLCAALGIALGVLMFFFVR